jgi:hypothetical protein
MRCASVNGREEAGPVRSKRAGFTPASVVPNSSVILGTVQPTFQTGLRALDVVDVFGECVDDHHAERDDNYR